MQLLLIRHASNDWLGHRLAGWTPGVHLNERGRAEAALLAARLAGHPIDAVYASPLDRTMETARYVAGPHDLEVLVDEAVGEIRCGEWEGRELSVLRADPLWARMREDPIGVSYPGGENIQQVQSRAVTLLERLRSEHGGVVAVVSHADVVKSVVAHYLGLPLERFRRLQVAPASLTVLQSSASGVRLVLFNDIGAVPVETAVSGTSQADQGPP